MPFPFSNRRRGAVSSSTDPQRDDTRTLRRWALLGGLLSGLEPFAAFDVFGLPWILVTLGIVVRALAFARGDKLGAREGSRVGARFAVVATPLASVLIGVTHVAFELYSPRRGLTGPLANVRATPSEAIAIGATDALVWAIAIVVVATIAGALFGIMLGPRKVAPTSSDAIGEEIRRTTIVGLFVGGRSSRMGQPKGLLVGPKGHAILVELANAAGRAGLECCLVGDAPPYEGVVPELPRIADDADAEGPLAGLLAFLAYAGDRHAIAIACDMPFVDHDAIVALATFASVAPIVAARASDDAPWEPFLARYDAPIVLPLLRMAVGEGERSPRRAIERIGAERFVPPSPLALRDWDTPEDVAKDRGDG